MKLNSIFLPLLLCIILTTGCNKDEDPVPPVAIEEPSPTESVEEEPEEEPSSIIFKEEISGYVQKGPFINGTNILISELDHNLNSTGRNFATQISDNKGSFSIKNVKLNSKYVSLKADGFYFNEVSGINSTAPLTLYALTDLSDISTANVNVLSYLEKARTEFLISQDMEFAIAKKQAQNEVLAIFEVENEEISNSEMLDISREGEENAILLAASVILQGNRGVSELSELMANIITDMKEDGVLDNESYGSALLNGVKNLDLSIVRKNVEERYINLGLPTTIGDFEGYVDNFIKNTDFVSVSEFSYPEIMWENLLRKEDGFIFETNSNGEVYIDLIATIPDNQSLRVLIKKIEGDWEFSYNDGWEIYGSSTDGYSELKSLKMGENVTSSLVLFQEGSFLVEIYEGNTMEPTFTRTIHWGPKYVNSYPKEGQYGTNLLGLPLMPTNNLTPGEYSIAVTLPDDAEYQLEVTINGNWIKENFFIDPAKVQNWEYELTDHQLILRCNGKGTSADMSVNISGLNQMGATISSFEMEKHISW